MSPRKTTYKHIRFPLDPQVSQRGLLSLYLKEFEFIEPLGSKDVIALYVNMFTDFLENKIGSHAVNSFSLDLLHSLDTHLSKSEWVREPILRTLRSDIISCLDIVWLMDSPSFEDIKKEMTQRLKEYYGFYHSPTLV